MQVINTSREGASALRGQKVRLLSFNLLQLDSEHLHYRTIRYLVFPFLCGTVQSCTCLLLDVNIFDRLSKRRRGAMAKAH